MSDQNCTPMVPADLRCPECNDILAFDDGHYYCHRDGSMGETRCPGALKRYRPEDDEDESTLAVHVVDAYGASRELARCADDALTFTLRTLTSEGQITSEHDVGVLDLESCAWLVSPYPASVFGRRNDVPAR